MKAIDRKRRLIHPLWMHVPAVSLLAAFVAYFLANLSRWPSRIPLQVGWAGVPTSTGSPWTSFGLVAGLGVLFIVLATWLDELWARQESHKQFNVLGLLDEVVLAVMVTVHVGFLSAAARGADTYAIRWTSLLIVLGTTLLVGVLLEVLRPFAASRSMPIARSTKAFREDLSAKVSRNESVVFWDVQNPRYVSVFSLGLPLILWVAAGFLVQVSLWSAILEATMGVLFLFFYGGQRTRVTSEGVTIRYGLTGVRIFRCQWHEVSEIKVRSFAPLADFGGYGVRTGQGVTVYFLAGRTGVQLEMPSRRAALIGSANPERLAAAMAIIGKVAAMDEKEVAL